MRTFLIAFFVFLAWFAIAFIYISTDASSHFKSFLNDFTSQKNKSEHVSDVLPGSVQNQTDSDLDINKNKAKLYINDKNGEVLFSLDSISVLKNSDSFFYNSLKEIYFQPLLEHLKDKDDLEIIINSEYSATENFDTPNIGIKRGEFLRGELVKLGISPYILSVKSIIREIDFDEDNKVYGAVSFQMKPLDEERRAEIENNRVISQVVYPTFTFARILENKELRDYAKELKELFEANPNRKAKIIGHTDNIGSALDNYQQGLKYAQQVRWYLINREGFDPSRLTALSEGETNPIDNNNTQTGRKNNLRIEFIIE